jgi:hypothetical protein
MSSPLEIPKEIKAARPEKTQVIHLAEPTSLDHIETLFEEYERAPSYIQPFFKIRIELALRQRESLAASKEKSVQALLEEAQKNKILVDESNTALRKRLGGMVFKSLWTLPVQLEAEQQKPQSIDLPDSPNTPLPITPSSLPWTGSQNLPPLYFHTRVDGNDPEKAIFRDLIDSLNDENFDQIAFQILQLLNNSDNEKGGPALTGLVYAIFETATDHSRSKVESPQSSEVSGMTDIHHDLGSLDLLDAANSSTHMDRTNKVQICGKLCQFLLVRIRKDIQVEGIVREDGGRLSGGPLFCKLILNLCQLNSKWYENPHYPRDENSQDRKLAIIRFTGELFIERLVKYEAITGRIKYLINITKGVNEERIECLCVLMERVGSKLDKKKKYMDRYFSQLGALATNRMLSTTLRRRLKVSK